MATELAKAYVQIIPSARGIKGGIQKEIDPEAEPAGESFGGKLIGKIKGIIATAAIGKALASTISEGAALEQSIGGIETLFKDSADKVKENAAQAYRTAGMSANDYMELTTSFSASLLSSLANDTSKAADVADMAMVDMSDNANKMGTNMEDIKNAYQGFAKQNYTMLDNLKLGYGGTKTEMERLLADAQKISGVEYNIDNLSDVYSAIHVIQGQLDITGTTAKEAATTISGSFNQMKAAAKNVMGQITLGMDVGPALNQLADTIVTYAVGNLLPALWNIVSALPSAIVTFITALGPQVATAFMTFIPQIGNGFATEIPALCAQFLPIIMQISENLRANAGTLVDAGLNLIVNLAQGIANSLPTLIATVPTIITNIAGIINDNLPKMLTTGMQILIILAKGIIQALPTLVANLPQIFTACASVLQAMNWISIGRNIMKLLVNGVKALMHLPGQILKGAFNTAKELITNGFSWGTVGGNIIIGIANGLKAAGHMLWDAVKGILGSFKDNVLSFFGIHSPSRWGIFVGEMIDTGVAKGLAGKTSLVSDAANELQRTIKNPFKADANFALKTNASESGTDRLTSKLEQLLEYLKQKSRGSDKIVINMNDREVARALREMGVVFE